MIGRFVAGILPVFFVMSMNPGASLAGHTNAKVNIVEEVAGTGEAAVLHSQVSVHYTGWLEDGTKFDSSRDRKSPFQFSLGSGQVIPGWDMGLEGMKVGGKRRLTIPPELGYGKKGAGGVIPPNATLTFAIELLGVEPPKYKNVDNVELKALLKRGVKIVDLRRPDEWKETGVVEGSKRLTAFDGNGRFVKNFPIDFQSYVEAGDEVILICRTGNRSATIANMLSAQAGYEKVFNVQYGIEKWKKAGNPVVR